MYCSKCGKELPDDVLFCSGCGTETVNNKRATDNVIKNTYRDENAGRIARQSLVSALEQEEKNKSTRLAVIGVIAFISSIIAIGTFSSLSSEGKITFELLMTLFFSFSTAVGLVLGMIKVNVQCNKRIKEKQEELDQYDKDIEIK